MPRSGRLQSVIIYTSMFGMIFGTIAVTFFLEPLQNPADNMNEVETVTHSVTPAGNVDLPASHYYLVWFSNLPSQDAYFTWTARIVIQTLNGTEVINVTSHWVEQETHTSGKSGTHYHDPPGHVFWEGDLPAGRYFVRAETLAVYSNIGNSVKWITVAFNDPTVFRATYQADLAISLAVMMGPLTGSIVACAYLGWRDAREVREEANAGEAMREAAEEKHPRVVPRVVEDERPLPAKDWL